MTGAKFNVGSAEHRPEIRSRNDRVKKLLLCLSVLLLSVLLGVSARAFVARPFIPAQGSTMPSNGDLVPYGLAVVPSNFPGHSLKSHQLLVSNFNSGSTVANPAGLAGEGTTIVIIDPKTAKQTGLFFQGSSPIGFSNALAIVPEGFVFAGSVFTTPADPTDAKSGGLLVFDKNGNFLESISTGGAKGGPWGLAVNDLGDSAQLFVSNVLDGTVTRQTVSFKHGSFSIVDSPVTIGSGYGFAPDAAALVIGPAGLAYDKGRDRLYVASEGDNEIFSIDHASTSSSGGQGTLVFSDPHLEGPLGLIIAPNGDLITANADPAAFQNAATPSEIVEFTKSGQFVREFSIDPDLGAAFAILNVPLNGANRFAWVDDVTSSISILRLAE